MIKVVVSFSGGKDSQAALIWAINKYGADKVEAVFCDTGWEHPDTIKHVHEVCRMGGVRLTVLKNGKYPNGFEDMCKHIMIFPRPNQRFCTAQLKIKPMIDWIINSDDNFIIIQGIRGAESKSRAKMDAECSYFKEYFDGSVKSLYRKKDVQEWAKTHDASVIRPCFSWSAQQVIDYILDNGQQPNPLYKKGFSRVGCYPCILSNFSNLRIFSKDKEMVQRLIDLEIKVNANPKRNSGNISTFFNRGIIPSRYCKTLGNGCATVQEVLDYVNRNNDVKDFFEPEGGYSCMSLYHGLCE